MADWTTKKGDTRPILKDTLTYSDGTTVDLTGGSIKFVARSLTAMSPAVNAAGTITNNTNPCTVQYTPTAQDTAVAETRMCEWHATFSDGSTLTFPTDGYLEWTIEEDLITPGGSRLVSLNELKDHLRFPDTNRVRDTRLLNMVDAVTPVIEFITGPILQRQYSEAYDGGGNFISLRHRPVLEVQQVVEYRANIPFNLAQVDTPDHGTIYSYMFEPPGRIVRRTVGGGTTTFPWGPDSILVQYTAGYQRVPPNVREAVLELIRIRYDAEEQVGPSDDTERVGSFVRGFFVPNEIIELLEPNRRHISVA